MKLPNIYKHTRGLTPRRSFAGFTLIEMLVALGIMSFILCLGLFMSFDLYHHARPRNERDSLLSALYEARSHALANHGGMPPSVHYGSSTVTFSQLSATTTSTTLYIADGSSTTTIFINDEGTIFW